LDDITINTPCKKLTEAFLARAHHSIIPGLPTLKEGINFMSNNQIDKQQRKDG
jgi:hypothetical protein